MYSIQNIFSIFSVLNELIIMIIKSDLYYVFFLNTSHCVILPKKSHNRGDRKPVLKFYLQQNLIKTFEVISSVVYFKYGYTNVAMLH